MMPSAPGYGLDTGLFHAYYLVVTLRCQALALCSNTQVAWSLPVKP
jgi:hypothetical protein